MIRIGSRRVGLPGPNWRGWLSLFSPIRATYLGSPPYTIPVLVVCYFPIKGDRIDIDVTGDVGDPLADVRDRTDEATRTLVQSLEMGSTYHGYKDPAARPSLHYQVVDTIEFLEPLPVCEKVDDQAPMTDYYAIMDRVDIRRWVEDEGVKEVWLWAYHGDVVGLWESNMAGPYGDISNSRRYPDDLPVLSKTYTVYHYNYGRRPSEAMENHIHQIEHVLNYVDGRDETPEEKWQDLLFWGQFVGSDRSHLIVSPRCGWAHCPPNAEKQYDWKNRRYVLTDIEDWTPEGTGERMSINCERWDSDQLEWFVYWMQNLPGANNGITYRGCPLTNWWTFIGDFDGAMDAGLDLVELHWRYPRVASASAP
jgi:hypothetical protein